jgi:maleate isomerase
MAGTIGAFGSLRDLKKVGHITPSSNTALEPITALMNASLSDRVSHHFTRLPVRQMTLDSVTSNQFRLEPMIDAATLLAHSPLDSIVWNGTSASWLGVERDEELCRRIEDLTGIPASTSTLAIHDALREFGATRISLAVPYTADVTQRIAEVYRQCGFEVVSEAHLDQSINIDVANNSLERVRQLIRDSDSAGAECIAVVCTNLAATGLVDEIERELKKPIVDSIAATFWKGCRLAGVNASVDGWGVLMRGDNAVHAKAVG